MMTRHFAAALPWLFLLPAIALSQELSRVDLEKQFQQKLDQAFEQNPESIGIAIHVEAPSQELSWSSAVGVSVKGTQTQLDPAQPVLIASNTKPYVAASVLRLVELEKLKLSDAIKTRLTPETTKLFESDGYDFGKITIQHLLSHGSGIADYVDDDYFEFVGKNPKHQWNRNEQLKRSTKVGDPLFGPGTNHKYGDVNYLLLTEIIEVATGKPFQAAIPELLKFRDLKINHTWFESLQPRPESTLPLAHQYAGSRGWDSYQLNPSWDLYGGGGLAANTKDAAMFMQHLFNHNIVKDKSLIQRMHQRVFAKEQSNYCLGISVFQLDGFKLYYHGGWWGTDVAYCPEANCSIAMFVLEKDKRHELAKLSIDMIKSIVDLKSASNQ